MKFKLPVLTGSLSDIQAFSHPLTFNFPSSLGYIIRKLVFGSPRGNNFTPSFVCSQLTAPRNIKLAQTLPSGTSSHLGREEPWRFISCGHRNSCYAKVGFELQTSRSAGECTTTGPMCPFQTHPKVCCIIK